jgi:hypothetical protein
MGRNLDILLTLVNYVIGLYLNFRLLLVFIGVYTYSATFDWQAAKMETKTFMPAYEM